MLELAEVVGLEEQLTVPSRDKAHLVDLWIAIKRSSVGLEWEKQFTTLAQSSNAKLSTTGVFQAIPFTERRGWIVARGVDGKSISPSAVEDLARSLVAEANARIAAPVAVTVTDVRAPKARESLTKRVRTVITDGGAITLGSWLAPRRSTDVDIASNR